MTSIGDLLSAKNIPWKYYGGGYNASGTGDSARRQLLQHLQPV